MDLAYAFLAKFADTTRDGTFALVGGGFEVVAAPALPVTVPALAVVIRLLVPPNECGREHELRVDLVGPGEAAPRMTANLHFTPDLDVNRPGRPVGINCIMGTFGLAFAEQGDYEFRLSVGGRQLGSAVLSVIQRPA